MSCRFILNAFNDVIWVWG